MYFFLKTQAKITFYRYNDDISTIKKIYTLILHACQIALLTIPTVTVWSKPFLNFKLSLYKKINIPMSIGNLLLNENIFNI